MSSFSAPRERPVHVSGFHEGERAVQDRAGVASAADRLAGMLSSAGLSGGAAGFLAAQTFAVLVARDAAGDLWASPMLGRRGFLEGHDQVLVVGTTLEQGDPLQSLPTGQSAGLIAIDLQRRRRFRVNGWLTKVGPTRLVIEVEEAYGNCPAYIQQRAVGARPLAQMPASSPALTRDGSLSPAASRIVHVADTFFLGTRHPVRGADASHKGGNPGFVRIDGADILWPDYAGNNMFNSLGNLAADQSAALLVPDFTGGSVLQLSGVATLEWRPEGAASGDASTGRWVRFSPRAGVLRSSGMRAESTPADVTGRPDCPG